MKSQGWEQYPTSEVTMAKRKKVFRPLTALLFASAVVVAAASAAFAQVAVTAVAVADLADLAADRVVAAAPVVAGSRRGE